MEFVYAGKTKDVYRLEDGTIELRFKDDVTGSDGVFDPGANSVGLKLEGAGRSGLEMTSYFFERLHKQGINTHFIQANLSEQTMRVKSAEMFGNGLEVICRYKAVGSFYRRYGQYCEEGDDLAGFTEITLKDDKREDPPISKQGLLMLGLLTEEEYDEIISLTRQVSEFVRDELSKKGLALYDIKLEFGKDPETNDVMLIDEISGGNMRVYKDGEYVEPLELTKLLLG